MWFKSPYGNSDIWPTDPGQAVVVQKSLAKKVRVENDFNALEIIAGIDVSYDVQKNISRAFVVVMRRDQLKPILSVKAYLPTSFPYIPGFLSFREIPVIIEALQKLPEKPDVLMVDGQGIAHPRRLGIAAHLGVLMDMPAIGVAKSRLTGQYTEPATSKGSQSSLTHYGEKIGVVLRSKNNVKPLFISPGHRIDIETSVDVVMQCVVRHRLPEPTRIADKLSKTDHLHHLLV